MKKIVRLNESELKQFINESVKRVLREYEERPEEIGKLEDDNYYGGGLPDGYYDDKYPGEETPYGPEDDSMEETPVWNFLCNKIEKEIPNFDWNGPSNEYVQKTVDMLKPLIDIKYALTDNIGPLDTYRGDDGKTYKVTNDEIKRFVNESLRKYRYLYYRVNSELNQLQWLFG